MEGVKMFERANWFGLPVIQKYRGLDLLSLPLNRAYVTVNTSIDHVGVYSVNSDCFQCPYKLVKKLRAHEEVAWEVDTGGEAWKIMNFGDYEYIANHYRGGLICQVNPTFGEFGVYRLNVGACVVEAQVPPIQPYLPLLPFGMILLAIIIIYAATKRLLKCRKIKDIEVPPIERCEERMKSLNFLRGLLMTIIIFASSGGGGYLISKKLGVSIPDLAFNALAWTVGVHIPYAVDTDLSRGRKKWAVVGNIWLRSSILIISSLLIDSTDILSYSPNIVWSPLKRIVIVYLVAGTTYSFTAQRFDKKSKTLIWKVLSTIITLLWSWILFGVVLAVLIICMLCFASFNCFENPVFNHQRLNYSNVESEVAVVCDNIYTELANRVLTDNRSSLLDVSNYSGYSSGLLGTLTTILHAVIGLKTGVIFAHYESHSEKVKLFATWATLVGFIGCLLVLVPLPVSINVWPIASIFLISTLSACVQMVVYWCTEIHHQTFTPVSSLGSSYLLILFGDLLFSKSIPFSFSNISNNHFWCLIQNTWSVVLWMIIAEILVRRNVRISA